MTFTGKGRSGTCPAAWTVVAVVLLGAASETAQNTAPAFPGMLQAYLARNVRLTPDESKHLVSGDPVTRVLDVKDPSKEVAVFGAIWIDAPIRRYVDLVNDIEALERGDGFKVTRRIGTPPALGDFAAMHLADEDVKDLRTCRVGNCDVKLSEPSLRRFQAEVDWSAPDAHARADALMRQLALEYVTGYLKGGNEQLAVYRDRSRPTFVAREFREMVDEMPALTSYAPDVRRYLLGYPQVTLPGSTSFLYWQETEFGLKPTLRLSHLTIREGPVDAMVVSKMLYATHYFWTGLEVRALIADPSRGPGFWFVTVNRGRSDGLSGFTGVFVRRRVRSEVEKGALAELQTTKQKVEGASALPLSRHP